MDRRHIVGSLVIFQDHYISSKSEITAEVRRARSGERLAASEATLSLAAGEESSWYWSAASSFRASITNELSEVVAGDGTGIGSDLRAAAVRIVSLCQCYWRQRSKLRSRLISFWNLTVFASTPACMSSIPSAVVADKKGVSGASVVYRSGDSGVRSCRIRCCWSRRLEAVTRASITTDRSSDALFNPSLKKFNCCSSIML